MILLWCVFRIQHKWFFWQIFKHIGLLCASVITVCGILYLLRILDYVELRNQVWISLWVSCMLLHLYLQIFNYFFEFELYRVIQTQNPIFLLYIKANQNIIFLYGLFSSCDKTRSFEVAFCSLSHTFRVAVALEFLFGWCRHSRNHNLFSNGFISRFRRNWVSLCSTISENPKYLKFYFINVSNICERAKMPEKLWKEVGKITLVLHIN